MLPEDDRMIENTQQRFKCFNVNFRLLKAIYVLLLVCYLNQLQNEVFLTHAMKAYRGVEVQHHSFLT